MHPPSRQDYVAITLGQRTGSYNNSKQWRRQSCWRKWKQLSRLQRSLILFTLVLLLICGLASYPTITEHLRGGEQETDEVHPLAPHVLPEPAKLGQLPRPEQPSKRKLSNKRGPPLLQNLQRNVNTSNVVEEKVIESKKEGEEQGVISWRGAVIDTEQGTEGAKEGETKEGTAADQEAKTVKESGLYSFVWSTSVPVLYTGLACIVM